MQSDAHVPAFDCRLEQTILRKAAESEARFRHVIEAKRQALAEKQERLQAQVTAAEEELKKEKEAAREVQTEVSLERWEERQKARMSTLWPEVEEAAAAVRDADEKVAQLRQEALQQSEDGQHQLEVSASLYQMYAAATGVRWDMDSASEGYIAIDQKARPFKVQGKPGSKASADALWAEIEACLPAAAPSASSRDGGA
eukprot:gb/GFBE01078009.1/.p1 GENE.gb/GFBE01078009.1/~~gb/GFBE01078009.1/.p1  ORF type:complete len:199 (+),score=69.31 gb/GFBE01078009.1/:1-597(+)